MIAPCDRPLSLLVPVGHAPKLASPAFARRRDVRLGAGVLLRHYLEQGLSKTAIAARVGLSRRTVYRWLAQGKLDGDLDATTVHYPPRPTKLDPYKALIGERLTTYPEHRRPTVRRGGFRGSRVQIPVPSARS